MKARGGAVRAAPAHEDATAILLAWCEANEKQAGMVRVMRTLATHSEMRAAWAQLARAGVPAKSVLRYVRSAWRRALDECRRPSRKDERDGIELVVSLAGRLREAIDKAPLSRQKLAGWALTVGSGEEALALNVCWGEVPSGADALGLGPTLSLRAAVLLVERQAQQELDGLQPRALVRRSDDAAPPEGLDFVRAFTRQLAYEFKSETGAERRAVISRIGTALFPNSPLDPKAVEALLKDRPPELVHDPRKGRKLRP